MAKTYYYLDNKEYPFVVSKDTLIYTPHTFNNRGYEEKKSINTFYKNIPRDKPINIVDIGAQSGLYTLFAKYLPNATYYSFEPFPTSMKLLKQNIELNNITNVNLYNVAVSDKVGTNTLNVCISHNGLHTLGNSIKRFKDSKQITVETTTIDTEFYEKNIPIDYLKIDTEGCELNILKGGEKTILKYKPNILLEWYEINLNQFNQTLKELDDYVLKLGYVKASFHNSEMYLVHSSNQ